MRVTHTDPVWSAQATKFRPVNWERIAVVGEELGTQRDAATVPISVFEDMRATAATLTAELAQLRRYNEDLVQQALARGAEVEQLRRDNELLVQLANDAAAAHVAELAKLMASAAQTPQTSPAPTPRDPWANALRHQRQAVGLLTERQTW